MDQVHLPSLVLHTRLFGFYTFLNCLHNTQHRMIYIFLSFIKILVLICTQIQDPCIQNSYHSYAVSTACCFETRKVRILWSQNNTVNIVPPKMLLELQQMKRALLHEFILILISNVTGTVCRLYVNCAIKDHLILLDAVYLFLYIYTETISGIASTVSY